jgi:hypothetical protein
MMVMFVIACAFAVMFAMRFMQGAHACASSRLGGMMSCCGAHPVSRESADAGFAEPDHSAFAEYRAETLQRLENEQREVQQFLNRLRATSDTAEFDQFMAERKVQEQSIRLAIASDCSITGLRCRARWIGYSNARVARPAAGLFAWVPHADRKSRFRSPIIGIK